MRTIAIDWVLQQGLRYVLVDERGRIKAAGATASEVGYSSRRAAGDRVMDAHAYVQAYGRNGGN